jgi:hypothetical protein
MRIAPALFVLAALLSHVSAPMAAGPGRTVYVNCDKAPGGDGTMQAPVSTIGAAMSIARSLGSNGQNYNRRGTQ